MAYIFIGLGGTGTKIINHAAEAIRKSHGEETLGQCRFISVDTCLQDMEAFTTKIPGRYLRMVRIGDTGGPQILERWGVEYKPAEVDKFFYSWFPRRGEPGETQMGGFSEGAQGMRIGGRLAFFYNAERFVDAFRAQVAQLGEISTEKGQRIDSSDLSVFIAASFSNGTGGGCFLDVANMVRRVIRSDIVQGNAQVNGVFFTGDVAARFHKGSGAANVAKRWRRNGIHCLVETDYWLRSQSFRERKGGTREYDLYYPSVKDASIQRDRASELEGELFSVVYLVGPKNARSNSLATYDHYVSIAAESLVGLAITHGARLTDELPELKRPDDDGSPRKYASLGRVKLEFPVKAVRETLGNKVAGDSLKTWLKSQGTKDPLKEAKSFASQHNLDIESLASTDLDPVTGLMTVLEKPRTIDAFRTIRSIAENGGEGAETGADVRRVIQDLQEHLEAARTRYREARDEALARHFEAGSDTLLLEIGTVASESGLGAARAELNALIDHLDGVAENLFRQVEARRKDPHRRATLDENFSGDVEDLFEGVGKLPWGKKKRLRNAQDQAAADLVDRVSTAMVEGDLDRVHGLLSTQIDLWRTWAVRLERLVEELGSYSDGLGRSTAPKNADSSLEYVVAASNPRFLAHLSESFTGDKEVLDQVPRFLGEVGTWVGHSFLSPNGPLTQRHWDGVPDADATRALQSIVNRFTTGLLPDESPLLPHSLEEGLKRYIDWILAPYWRAAERKESNKAKEILHQAGKEDPLLFNERARERLRTTLEEGALSGPERKERDRKDLVAELITRLAKKAAPWLGVPEQAWDAGPKSFLRINERANSWLVDIAGSMTETMSAQVGEVGSHVLALTTFAGGASLKSLFPANRHREMWEASFDDIPPPWPDKRYFKTPIRGGDSWFHDPWEGVGSALADKILIALVLLHGLDHITWLRPDKGKGKDRLVAKTKLGAWIQEGTNLGLGWDAAVTQAQVMPSTDLEGLFAHLGGEIRRIWASAPQKGEARVALQDLLKPAQEGFNARTKGPKKEQWDALYRKVTTYLDPQAPEKIDEIKNLFAPGA